MPLSADPLILLILTLSLLHQLPPNPPPAALHLDSLKASRARTPILANPARTEEDRRFPLGLEALVAPSISPAEHNPQVVTLLLP